MNHQMPTPNRRTTRAFIASLISYLMLVGPMAPLAMAARGSAIRVEAKSAAAAPAPAAAPKPAPLAFTPNIGATKTDALAPGGDANNNGLFDPGDTIQYTVTITNNGTTAATGVTFTDTVDTNTSLVLASISTQPIANNDTFTAFGNVRISTANGAANLLANDCDPDNGPGCSSTGLTASGPTTGPTNGQATVNADGSFSYNPNPGYTGSDSFTYTVTDGQGKTDTATANITVGPTLIWFINNDPGAPAGNDGRITSPFNSIAAYNASAPTKDAGDIIFIYQGTSAYSGNLTLANTMKLIGQGASLASEVPAPPAGSEPLPGVTSNPTINSAAGNTVTLAQNNTIRGLTLNDSAGLDISGSGFGTLTVSAVTLSGTGRPLFLNNGALAATFDQITSTASTGGAGINLLSVGGTLAVTNGTTITDPSNECVLVTGSTVTANFGNTTCSDATNGIALSNNASGTRTFGTLSVTGGTLAAFSHTDPDGAGAAVGGGTTTVGATTISNPGTSGVVVAGSTTPVSFGNTSIMGSGAASVIYTGSSGNLSFPDLDITPDNNQQAISTIGNSGTLSATSGAISTTGAAALDLSSTVLSLVFDSVSAAVNGSANNGINIVGGSGSVSAPAGTITGGTNPAVNVNGGSVSLTYGGGISQSNNAALLRVVGGHTGTLTFNTGTISATNGTGLQFDNADGSYNFNGTTTMNGGDAGVDILNGSGGTFAFGGATITNPTGVAFNVDGTTAAVTGGITISGVITKNNDGKLIDFHNYDTGTATFSGNPSCTVLCDGIEVTNNGTASGNVNFTAGTKTLNTGTSTAVNLDDNDGGSVNFTNGGLDIDTTTGNGFRATGGGTVTIVTGASPNTIDTTAGEALHVSNTTIGAGGLTFRSINAGTVANTAGNGITLSNTGATAGLTITGNGGTCGVGVGSCTGGTIQHKTGADASTTAGIGIYLNNTRDISLTNVQLNDFDNYAIYGSNVTNFTFTTSRVTGSNGTSSNPVNEACVRFDGLLGNALITGSTITNTNPAGGATNALHVNNASGTLTLLDIQSSTIGNQNALATPANSGQDAIFFGSPSGATGAMNLRLNNSTLTHARQFLLQVNIQGTKTANLEITNNTLHNQHPSVVNAGGGSNITGGGTDVYVKYLISGNSFRHTPGVVNGGRSMTIGHASGNAAFDGKFLNNTIGQTGVPSSGAGNAADGLGIFASGNNSPTMGGSKARIEDNTIQRYGEAGIIVNARQGSSTLDVTIFGNIIREPGTAALGAFAAIWVNSGALPADTNIVNIVIGSATVAADKNTMTNSDPSNATDVFLDKNTCGGCASQLRLYQNGSDAAGATTEDKVRDVINDDNIGPLDLLTGFTNASAITLVAAGLPVQPTASSDITGTGDGGDQDATSEETPSAAPEEEPASGGVTSQPFVSMPVAAPAAQTAPADGVALSPPAQGGETAPTALGGGGDEEAETPPSGNNNPVGGPLGSGGTVNVNIGTLNPGDSVTITFNVVIDDPFLGNDPEVLNQGTINYGPGGLSTVTDDPSTQAANDATVTPIVVPPDVYIRDAKIGEPASGSANMIFTVVLSGPASGALTVNFTTADEPAGPGKAVAGQDYTTTSGSVVFAAGENLKTISVPVLADAEAEPDETFLVNLTGATGSYATIAVSQATGTITPNTPGTTLISEVRTSGPGGAGDDYVEIYNDTNTPLNVGPTDWVLVASNGGCTADPVVLGTITAGTTIPARGHFLFYGSQYSMSAVAPGDQLLTADIADDANVALFSAASLFTLSSAEKLDGVGFGLNTNGVCDLLREGATLPTASGSTQQYAFVREYTLVANDVPTPTDLNDNASDFTVVSTTATTMPVSAAITAPTLGAPGPQDTDSPNLKKYTQVGVQYLDPAVAPNLAPNRVRKGCVNPPLAEECLPNRSAQGTMQLRRTFTNNTGGPITRLRFRVYDVTGYPITTPGNADMRLLSAPQVTGVTGPSIGTVTVEATTLDAPTQTDGGGLNSSVTAGIINLGNQLANGASIHINFMMGVQQTGNYRVFVYVEALP